MKQSLIRFALAGLAALMLSGGTLGAAAAPGQTAALAPDETAAVNRAIDYLNGIDTMSARFVQTSSNGARAQGTLLIDRPGKMRFEYDPPHPALLIADGTTLLLYDRELKEATYLPLWETPIWFLIRKNVSLSGSMRIRDVQQDGQTLRVTLVDDSLADAGIVTLVFARDPMALQRWEVVDAQGILTEVALQNPAFDVEIARDAFDHSNLEMNVRTQPLGR